MSRDAQFLKALETGELEIDRWNSYQKLKAESSYIEDKESYLIAKGKRRKRNFQS